MTLKQEQIIDKNGHRKTVWVRYEEQKKAHVKATNERLARVAAPPQLSRVYGDDVPYSPGLLDNARVVGVATKKQSKAAEEVASGMFSWLFNLFFGKKLDLGKPSKAGAR